MNKEQKTYYETLRFPVKISDSQNLIKEKITKKDIEKYDLIIDIDYDRRRITYQFVEKEKSARSLAALDFFDFNFDDFQDAVEYLKDLAEERLSE